MVLKLLPHFLHFLRVLLRGSQVYEQIVVLLGRGLYHDVGCGLRGIPFSAAKCLCAVGRRSRYSLQEGRLRFAQFKVACRLIETSGDRSVELLLAHVDDLLQIAHLEVKQCEERRSHCYGDHPYR